MRKIKSAKLFHLVTLLKNISSESSLSGDDWRSVGQVYAEIKPLSEQQIKEIDSIQFGHLILEEYFIFTCRYSDLIENNMRIQFKERIFDIKRIINPQEKDRYLKIITLEIK